MFNLQVKVKEVHLLNTCVHLAISKLVLIQVCLRTER